jgi:RHS repeat-associated protein
MKFPRIQIILRVFLILLITILFSKKVFAQSCVNGFVIDEVKISSSGGNVEVGVYCIPEYCDSWYLSYNANWIYAEENYENETIQIYIYSNESSTARQTVITVGSYSLYVFQFGNCTATQPGSISGPTSICSNSTVPFSIPQVSGATNYQWSISNDGTILSGQGNTSIEASFPGVGEATVSVEVTTYDCENGTPQTLNVNIIQGSTQVLQNQDTIILGTCPQLYGTQDIAARDEVILSPGFTYSATQGDSFTARINRTIIQESTYLQGEEIPDPDDRSLNTNLVVGSTEGSYTTTPLGGASYTIPIFCSPGTNGIQPSLSLQYNSQAGNDIMGWGWGLAGLSSISRMVKPYYVDNSIKPIDMLTGDQYSLDGNRLVLSTGTQGFSGSTYMTELESFTETTAHGTSGNGPSWFEVYNKKDGSVSEYGNDDHAYLNNSQNTRLIWYLTKYKDVNGNYVKYNYSVDQVSGQIYLQSIQYTGNEEENLQPYNEVFFQYERRTDPFKKYIGGVDLPSALIISKITAKCQESTVRTYDLAYKFSNYSYLIEVKETGQNGAKFNSNVFAYNNPEPESYQDISYLSTTGSNDFKFADFNGDGLNDIAVIPAKTSYTSSDKIKLYLNTNGTGFEFLQNLDINPYTIDLGHDGQFYFGKFGSGDITDFNGDGKADFYTYEYVENVFHDPEFPDYYKLYKFYLWHENDFYTPIPQQTTTNQSLIIGDFDGNGKSDLFYFNLDEQTFSIGLTTNWTQYGQEGQISLSGNLNDFTSEIGLLDYNGDGKTEVFNLDDNNYFHIYGVVENQFTELITPLLFNYDKYCFGDINGDGNTDIFGYSNSGCKIFYSNGILFNQADFNPHQGLSSSTFTIADLNGDGKGDIIQDVSESNSRNLYAFFFYGAEFSLGWSYTFSNNYDSKIYYTDFNGDGQAEPYFRPTSSGGVYSGFINRIAPNNKSRLLSKFLNGYNIKTWMFYGVLPQSSNYTNSTNVESFPVCKLTLPVNVVEDVISYDSDGNPFSYINYLYEDFKVHLQGKGILGFSKVGSASIYDLTNTESSFGYGSHFNTYLSNLKLYKNSNLISETNNTPDVKNLDGGTRYFPFISTSITEDKVKNTLTEISTAFNATTCNLTSKITKAKTSEGTIVSQISESYADYNDFGEPESVSFISTRGTESITRSKTFEYNSNGFLLEETDLFGSSPSIVKSFTYDDYGNVLTSSIGVGSETRTNTFTYEPGKFRFVKTKTNPIGLTVTYNNDPFTGNILEESDHTNLKTSYTYDGFGRKTETRYPDGQTVQNSLDWSLNTAGLGELYYTTSESAHKPTAITYYDPLGRELRSKTQSFDGTYLVTDKNYDSQGRLEKSYMSYFVGGTADQYIEYAYDDIGRLSSETVYPAETSTSYTYDGLTTTIDKAGQTYEKEYDASGLLHISTDPGGSITYNYNPEEKAKSIISPSGTTSIDYDNYGYQDKLHDIDARTIDYNYNGFGELTSQVDSAGNQSTMQYDALGRILQKAWTGGETISYTYDNATGLLTNLGSPGGTKTYTYDEYYRVLTKTETVNNNNFTTAYSYDSYGNMIREVLNNSVTLDYVFNGYGYLDQVKANDQLIWDANNMDRYGKINNYTLGNDINTVISNDQNGFVDKIETKLGSTWIQNWDYDFEAAHGNMTKRKGLKSSGNLEEENFTYDNLDRLLTYTVGNDTWENTYDQYGKGNISAKSGIGDYYYSSRNVHRLDSIMNLSEALPEIPQQDITYTKFNKISTLTHTSPSLTKLLTFTYGPDEQRVTTVYTENSSTVKTKYFALGNYEKEIAADNSVRELYYVSTPTGIAAIIEKTGSQTNFYYVHTDIIGSLDVITNSSGTILERLSFDPWGRRRNPADWTYANVPATFMFDRGFTGHEHLDKFDLINMNGRVYDPLLAMFLSPDNNIQAPDLTQNFNRYSYCLNNPLIYTDPDGEFWNLIIGAAVGGVLNWATHGFEFSWKGLGYFGVGAVAGALGAGVGAGVSSSMAGGSFSAGFIGSSAALTATTSFATGAAIGSSAGFSSGFINGFGNGLLGGQDFGQSLWSGTKSGLIGGGSGALLGGFGSGIDAVKHGRDFWDGINYKNELQNIIKIGVYPEQLEGVKDIRAATARNIRELNAPWNSNAEGVTWGPLSGKDTKVLISKAAIRNAMKNPNGWGWDIVKHEFYHVDDFSSGAARALATDYVNSYGQQLGMDLFYREFENRAYLFTSHITRAGSYYQNLWYQKALEFIPHLP